MVRTNERQWGDVTCVKMTRGQPDGTTVGSREWGKKKDDEKREKEGREI